MGQLTREAIRERLSQRLCSRWIDLYSQLGRLLLYGNALGEVAGLVDVRAFENGGVVGEELDRDRIRSPRRLCDADHNAVHRLHSQFDFFSPRQAHSAETSPQTSGVLWPATWSGIRLSGASVPFLPLGNRVAVQRQANRCGPRPFLLWNTYAFDRRR
jgi:hypothetical protein